jgi:hypothetical protein
VRHPHPEGLAVLAYQALAQARAADVA